MASQLAKRWNRGLIEFRSIRYAGLYTPEFWKGLFVYCESLFYFSFPGVG